MRIAINITCAIQIDHTLLSGGMGTLPFIELGRWMTLSLARHISLSAALSSPSPSTGLPSLRIWAGESRSAALLLCLSDVT